MTISQPQFSYDLSYHTLDNLRLVRHRKVGRFLLVDYTPENLDPSTDQQSNLFRVRTMASFEVISGATRDRPKYVNCAEVFV